MTGELSQCDARPAVPSPCNAAGTALLKRKQGYVIRPPVCD